MPTHPKESPVIESYDNGTVLVVTAGAPFQFSENPIVEEKKLDDGDYWYWFDFYGPGETYMGCSQMVVFTIENGAIVDAKLSL